MTAIDTSMRGILQSQALFADSSLRLTAAVSPREGGDIGTPIVDQIEAEHSQSANIATLKVADDMQKRLIDIIA